MKVTPYETYQTYLSMKSHFTNRKYDFFKYGGKSRATVSSFNKRKDKYWFEKTSRKYSDQEITDFLLSNFVNTDAPQNLWIGEIINSGERNYSDWMKRQQSFSQNRQLVDFGDDNIGEGCFFIIFICRRITLQSSSRNDTEL